MSDESERTVVDDAVRVVEAAHHAQQSSDRTLDECIEREAAVVVSDADVAYDQSDVEEKARDIAAHGSGL